MRTIDLKCKVCNIDNQVTIHDTQDNFEDFEEEESDDDRELGIAATANT